MDILNAVILGIIQGLTEFLPVSSSGHLVLGEAFLGVKTTGILFEVAVHLATAGAVVLAYRKRIRGMFEALSLFFKPGMWSTKTSQSEPARLLQENFLLDCFVILGTIPAAVIGLYFKDSIESVFASPKLVCLMLIVTGLVLFCSRLAKTGISRPFSWWKVLLIGIAQATALLPGISRSGTTITAGLLLGLSPGKAAEFSFLLALPAILGAAVVEAVSLFGSGVENLPGLCPLVTGTAAAFFSGFAAIFFILKSLQKGRFDRFAWYCWAVGITAYFFL